MDVKHSPLVVVLMMISIPFTGCIYTNEPDETDDFEEESASSHDLLLGRMGDHSNIPPACLRISYSVMSEKMALSLV